MNIIHPHVVDGESGRVAILRGAMRTLSTREVVTLRFYEGPCDPGEHPLFTVILRFDGYKWTVHRGCTVLVKSVRERDPLSMRREWRTSIL